ncbi:MAG TPA: M48 family metallopeptidase [Nitrospirota bacterium]
MPVALLTIYLIISGIGYWFRYLNLSYLKVHGRTVPPEFEGVVEPALLGKISDYTIENSRAGLVESVAGNILVILFLFGGLLGAYDRWASSLTHSFIWGGVLFFLLLIYAQTFIDIPFSLYRNFRIENRYGFNTMTVRLWITDFVKSIALSTVLGSVAVMAALAIVQSSPHWWWLWVWAFFLVFGVFIMYISPYVIEPLFFKFEPVKAEGLEDGIRALMERAGLKVSRVFQVDASRRSRHSNAYFTGIGRVKRIVLFDTLIGQMTRDEILAVLAHEVGHWKKRHVLKRIIVSETAAFCGLFLAYRLLSWGGLPGLIGLDDASFYARVIVLGFAGSLAMFPLTPLSSFWSRRHEREADRFAAELTGRTDAMASALIKLSRENLSNLHPHPLYAKFYYSHPPVVERIRTLRGQKSDDR